MGSVSPITLPQSETKTKSHAASGQQKSKFRKYLPLYLSILPYFVIFLVFSLVPIIFSLYLAFQRWDGIGKMTFVGFNNFTYALTDPLFGTAILNTFEVWIMSTVPMLFLALAMAFLLNQRKRSKFLYQVCFFLPNITSIVAVTLIFNSFFGVQYGLFNAVLTALHLPAVQWFSDFWAMKWMLAMVVMWRWIGYNGLVYMAGLQSIPTDFYEAARLDGANTFNIFFRITIPLLRPVILFTVISSTIGGLTLFTEPKILFNGAAGQSIPGGIGSQGLTMSLYQYYESFTTFHFGYGAAVSWVIFFILVIFTLLNWKLVQRGEN
ncbi:carbohydrate ABC transporter permease [Dictyobacter arantiisoli]|uniref:Cytochrome c biogenesis protein n=1 Tax=Dictyobacter arantiisoli TaxID=2014874 RepID=A0A5A5TKL8_9CHLR|nr:sugar ABC transporter permease [Dictyobacter arantiisoli]GCF11583.1 cytochrome c biogenesis protein [Dictyobacter arantiisoli]